MRGTYHVIGGIAMLVMADSALLRIAPQAHDAAMAALWSFPPWPATFVLGCLLPDVDSRGSILGRHLRLPLGHRTWTHSLWPALALSAIAWLVPPAAPAILSLVAGMVTHLALDAVSVAGICWLYPWPSFRHYPSGAFVKRSNLHHRCFRWYHTGRRSETVVLVAFCLAAIASIIVARLA